MFKKKKKENLKGFILSIVKIAIVIATLEMNLNLDEDEVLSMIKSNYGSEILKFMEKMEV